MMKYEDLDRQQMLNQRYYSFKITAAGANRLLYWIMHCDCATISAERNHASSFIQEIGLDQYEQLNKASRNSKDVKELLDHYRVPNRINKANTNKLANKLSALSYGYIRVKGMYQEKGMDKPTAEESFFVFDRLNKGTLKQDMLKLANQLHQDSISFAKAGTQKFALLDTTPFSALPNQLLHGPSGKVIEQFNHIRYEGYIKPEVEPFYEETEEQKEARKLRRKLEEDRKFLMFFSQIRGKKLAWVNVQEINAAAKQKDFELFFTEEGQYGLRSGNLYSILSNTRLALAAEPELL